jgi:hypothetical protein
MVTIDNKQIKLQIWDTAGQAGPLRGPPCPSVLEQLCPVPESNQTTLEPPCPVPDTNQTTKAIPAEYLDNAVVEVQREPAV